MPFGPACFYFSPGTKSQKSALTPPPAASAATLSDQVEDQDLPKLNAEKEQLGDHTESQKLPENNNNEDSAEKERFFVPLPKQEDATRGTDCQESLFCQFLVLEKFAGKVSRCFSYFHAGPGQLSLTHNHRRRMDCTLVLEPGHLLFINYHSSSLHYAGHMGDCPAKPGTALPTEDTKTREELRNGDAQLQGQEKKSEEVAMEVGEEKEEATEEDEEDLLLSEEEDEDEGRSLSPQEFSYREEISSGEDRAGVEEGKKWRSSWTLGGRRIGKKQYFETKGEAALHLDEMQDADDDLEWSIESGEFRLNDATRRGNEDVKSYISCLNKAVRDAQKSCSTYPNLVFGEQTEYACHFFHGNAFKARRSARIYHSLRQLLLEEHPDDSLVLGGALLGKRERVGEQSLLRRLLADDSLTGFVTVRSGQETRRDISSLVQGYCLGKFTSYKSPLEDLGYFAKQQAEAAGEDLKKNCKKRCLTMTRLGYGPDQLTTMSVTNLRFLCQERLFRNFEVVHFIGYEVRPWHFAIISRVIQERHRLKRESPGDLSGINACKLFLNALYGFTFKEARNFNTTTLASQSRVQECKVGRDPNLVACTLVGTRPARYRAGRRDARCRKSTGSVNASQDRGKRLEMIFALTRKNPGALVRNLIQVASGVLCHSRNIFYGHLLFLITVMDPTRLQCAYFDTDSAMLLANKPTLKGNVRPELMDVFLKNHNAVFEDPTSPLAQNNRLKLEGVFSSSFFYSLKQYILLPLDEAEDVEGGQAEVLKKTKGISKVVRMQMEPHHFMLQPLIVQDSGPEEQPFSQERLLPEKRKDLLAASWILRGTRGLQVMMSIRTTRFVVPVNYKRHTVVRRVSKSFFPACMFSFFFFSPSFKATLSHSLNGHGAREDEENEGMAKKGASEKTSKSDCRQGRLF